MKKILDNCTTMEDSEANSSSSSVLSASILKKFKEEFEKTRMFQFTPEMEGKLRKCVDETLVENQFTLTADVEAPVPNSEQLEQTTLPPLVLQFNAAESPRNTSVLMGMLINGKPEVLKNEQGSESTPCLVQVTHDKRLVYGADALKLVDSLPPDVPLLCNLQPAPRPPNSWRYKNSKHLLSCLTTQQHFQKIDLKDFGIYFLPTLFFNAFLIRNLKITAEAGRRNDGGSCQIVIIAVPMQAQCAQRRCLKESAKFAGFETVFLISAEAIAAYYWFYSKEVEMEQNNYSKEFVIIDLFGHAVIYKKIFEDDDDNDDSGKKILTVRPVIFLYLFSAMDKEEDSFRQKIQKTLKLHRTVKTVIPVIREKNFLMGDYYLGTKYKRRIGIVKDDESDEFKYFAVKGAALLSENPENIERQIYNMINTTIEVQGSWQLETILPVRRSVYITHYNAIYVITQTVNERWGADEQLIGYLAIDDGAKYGTKLEVSYELSWEGIWKVVGVSTGNPEDDDEENYEEVKWRWLISDQMDYTNFGGSSYEECKSLLLKVTSSSLSQTTYKVESAVLTKEDSSESLCNHCNSQLDCPKTQGCDGTSNNNRVQNGIHKRKREVIRPNDIIVNTGLKKIKLESDWVSPAVVKTEKDSTG